MLKKIKDTTLDERLNICSKHFTCDNCPLKNFKLGLAVCMLKNPSLSDDLVEVKK